MTIETRITGSAEYGRWLKALFVGEPGSGKTLLSSTFPNPYFANAEGGLMSVAARRIPFTKITASEQVHELYVMLHNPPEVREKLFGRPVDTIIVDTIDEIQRIIIRERLASERIPQLRIQDYSWLGEQMQGILRGYRNLDMHVVFTAHLKDVKDDESGRMSYKPAMVGAIAGEIAGYVDLSLLLTSRPQTVVGDDNEARTVPYRYLQTTQDLQYPWIKDRSGKLPERFGINFDDDFDRLSELIFEGFDELPATTVEQPAKLPAKPATPVKVEGNSFTCDECNSVFDDADQATLSNIKTRRVLCAPCYKEAAA